MDPSYRVVQIVVTIINLLSLAACVWMFNLYSKAKEKSVSFVTVVILLISNLIYHITNISILWAGNDTGNTLEITNALALYSSLFWSVAISYLVYQASLFAFLPTQDSYPYFNWVIFGSFMSACVWVTISRFGRLQYLPRNIVIGILVVAVLVLYIMTLSKVKNPPPRGITSSVKAEIKVWGASFLCTAIFLGLGTITQAFTTISFSMWVLLLASSITGISSVAVAAVYKSSVYTRGASSSGTSSSNSRSAFAGRGYTLM